VLLLGPSLAGGLAGSLLLILMPESVFQAIIPWLLLTAALLFMNRYLQQGADAGLPGPGACAVIAVFQFLVGVYGGYFGAGIGILTLTALGLMGLGEIHRMNGVKTILAAAINAVSVVVFVACDLLARSGSAPRIVIEWRYGPVMAVAAIVGGYSGARVSRRLPRPLVRWVVILIGLGLAAFYFAKPAGN
jgi:uncharacterized membrane protein YfcA